MRKTVPIQILLDYANEEHNSTHVQAVQATIYEALSEAGITCKMYAEQSPDGSYKTILKQE